MYSTLAISHHCTVVYYIPDTDESAAPSQYLLVISFAMSFLSIVLKPLTTLLQSLSGYLRSHQSSISLIQCPTSCGLLALITLSVSLGMSSCTPRSYQSALTLDRASNSSFKEGFTEGTRYRGMIQLLHNTL